uniref:Uncharacterized protein n=1 Tax=Salix viminalis TaxID=40686 RepID=A0A6N2KAI3_SALVM
MLKSMFLSPSLPILELAVFMPFISLLLLRHFIRKTSHSLCHSWLLSQLRCWGLDGLGYLDGIWWNLLLCGGQQILFKSHCSGLCMRKKNGPKVG